VPKPAKRLPFACTANAGARFSRYLQAARSSPNFPENDLTSFIQR
jgi:hypothetical protein